MVIPVKLGLGAPLGSGQQIVSWIHLDDLCRLFIGMLTNDAWQGAYNAVASFTATNQTSPTCWPTCCTGRLMPKIPAFVFNLLLGE